MIIGSVRLGQASQPSLKSILSHTLGGKDSGMQIHNAGATGPVTYTLPPATEGMSFDVANIANLQKLTMQAIGTDYFQAITWASAAGGSISQTTTLANKAAYVKLQCFETGVWHLVLNYGFATP